MNLKEFMSNIERTESKFIKKGVNPENVGIRCSENDIYFFPLDDDVNGYMFKWNDGIMTEKRFKIDEKGVLIDTLTTETFKTVEDVVDILNYYENTCLRFEKRIRELKDNKEDNHISHGNLSEEKYKGLPYGYYTDSKADEMIRDLLEPKPFNCSDRIKR